MVKDEEKSKKLGITLLAVGALLGLMLIFIGNSFEGDSEGVQDISGLEYAATPSAEEYARSVEEKVEKLCSRVHGVKNVSVVVTLAGGYNAIYAQNSQSSSSGYKNEFVLIGSGSSEKALIIGYSTPKISGIGIVCTGGGTSYIKNEIISLVSASFEVSTNKIYVVEAQK